MKKQTDATAAYRDTRTYLLIISGHVILIRFRCAGNSGCHAIDRYGNFEKYRTKSGGKVQARNGVADSVAAGKVVVGAMGSLQPRVHIMGRACNRAMREAERLEQEGAPGMANVSQDFLREVRREAVVHQNSAKPGRDHLRQRHSRSAFPSISNQ